jgi:hypothetical protein
MEPPPEEQQGIAAILNQAQQAGPTIANNQAAAQQQQLVDQAANKAAPAAAQMLQQTQQPQGMAHGGLAALPAHIQEFKEGGVIGYEEGGRINKTQFMGPQPEEATSDLGNLYNLLFTTDPEEQRRNLIANKLRLGIGQMPVGFAESVTPSERASRLSQESQLRGMLNAITGSTQPDAAEAAAREMTVPVAPAVPVMATPAASAKPSPKATAPAAPSATSTKVSASTREKIGSPTAPEKSGIDAIPVPSAQPIDMTEANALYEQSKQLRSNKPDFEARGLADIAAMQQRDKDSSAFRRYAAIAGARRPGINAGASMMAAAGKFAETEDALANQADAAKTALAKAKYAESIGDVEALLKYQEEFNKHKEAYSTLKAHLDATIYNAKMGATSREEIAAMRADAAQQMMALRLQTSSIGKNLKNPVDVMNIVEDNMEKYMKGWTDSREGRMAKGPEREAEYNKRKLQMILEMKAMGAVVPEGVEKLLGGAQTTRTVNLNP